MAVSNCGKFIRTFKGNLLIYLEVNGRPFFFYMTPRTGLRFISGHEKTRGNYVTRVEWDWAIANWDAKVEELTGRDLYNAKRLAPEIAANFIFCMSVDEVAKLPKTHAKSFN